MREAALQALIMRLALEIVLKVLFGAHFANQARGVGARLEVLMRFFAGQSSFTLRLLPRSTETPGKSAPVTPLRTSIESCSS